MNLLARLWAWTKRAFTRRPRPLRTVVVEDLPEDLQLGYVYLIGENNHFWSVALRCPCRCGDVIQLNLVAGTHPLWAFELEPKSRTITLRPSVWRTAGCRSHFFLRGGLVEWCHTQAPPTLTSQQLVG